MFLDAPNASNVAKVLKHNSKFAQIIIVSLRKVTLTCADHLHGVTMHGKKGKGISIVHAFVPREGLKYIIGDDLQDDEKSQETGTQETIVGYDTKTSSPDHMEEPLTEMQEQPISEGGTG